MKRYCCDFMSQFPQYPIIKVPSHLLSVKGSIPGLKIPPPRLPIKPELKQISKPILPTKQEFDLNDGCFKYILYFAAIGCLMLWVATNARNKEAGAEAGIFGVLILGIVVIGIFSYLKGNNNDNKNYEVRLKKYNEELSQFPFLVKEAKEKYEKAFVKYEEDCLRYKEDLKKYEEQLAEIRTAEYVEQYRWDELVRTLEQSVKPERSTSRVTKGVTEDFFTNELKKSINLDVQQSLMLKFTGNEKGYYPDIVISDKETGLLIDIEIDEPYIGASGEPVHFIQGGDEKRDEYFVNNGWIVIRFAEE